jgi:hypothetical protein
MMKVRSLLHIAVFFGMLNYSIAHASSATQVIEMLFRAATLNKMVKPLNDTQNNKNTKLPPEKKQDIVTDKQYFDATAVKIYVLCMQSGTALANDSYCNIKKHLFEDCIHGQNTNISAIQIVAKCGEENGYADLTDNTDETSASVSNDDETVKYWLIGIGLCILFLLIWDVRRLKRRS